MKIRLYGAAAKLSNAVTRAQAAIHKPLKNLNSRLRGNDVGELHVGFATTSWWEKIGEFSR
jgi:hypothetical protein